VHARVELRRQCAQQEPVFVVELAELLVGDHQRQRLRCSLPLQRHSDEGGVALPAACEDRDAGVCPVPRHPGPPAAREQIGLRGCGDVRCRAPGDHQRARHEIAAGPRDHRCTARLEQVDRGARDLVKHLPEVGAVEPPVEVERERLQPLQAASEAVPPLGRVLHLGEDARLLDRQAGEPADAPRQLHLLVGEVAALAAVPQLGEGQHALPDAERDDKLGVVAEPAHQVALGTVQPGVLPRRDDHRPAAADGHRVRGEVVDRVLSPPPLRGVEHTVVVADQGAQDARLGVDLVDLAGGHVQRLDQPRRQRLEEVVHVAALGEVQAGVAHQLEVTAPPLQLGHEAHVVDRDAEVSGEALAERDLLAAVLARVLPPVVHEHADLALQRAHGQHQDVLQPQVDGERRQR